MFKIILITISSFLFFSLFMSGCSTSEPKAVSEKIRVPFKTMYLKSDSGTLKKGEAVGILEIKNNIAFTARGKIDLSSLEDVRKEFRLSIITANGAKIKILNIKPKYEDGIWLKEGKYHIEVSAQNHVTYREWIKLSDDTTLNVSLKKVISKGFARWGTEKGVKYIDGLFWQDQTVNQTNKMNWNDAQRYCSNLVVRNNKNIIDDFVLPTESELKLLSKSTSILDNIGSVYWSSTVDENHNNFAKDVYVNKNEDGLYNKRGSNYVRCVSRKNYPQNLSLNALAILLQSEKKSSYTDAMENAIHIKYSKPVIKHILYDKKRKTFTFTLRSQKHDAQNKYYYNEIQTIVAKHKDSKKIKYLLNDSNFEPIIEFEILNDKLVFRGIEQFK